jgi:hypothetical protein
MFANAFLTKALVRSIVLAALALVFWSVVARPSGAHGPKTLYHVRPYDTLWTIASSHYAGDAGAAVWQIERANHLSGVQITPGEKLVLP